MAIVRSEDTNMPEVKPMTAGDISEALRMLGGFGSIYIPEFTWGDRRIDAAILDTRTRWIRGFEIKVSRADFKQDDKWVLYTKFCSSLSIVCPKGLIQPSEVEKPFGLLWVSRSTSAYVRPEYEWVKKPVRFQSRSGLAWLWTYVGLLERELPRLDTDNGRLRDELGWAMKELEEWRTGKKK